MPVAVNANRLRLLFYRALPYANHAMLLALVVGAADSYARENFVFENQMLIPLAALAITL